MMKRDSVSHKRDSMLKEKRDNQIMMSRLDTTSSSDYRYDKIIMWWLKRMWVWKG